MATYKIPPLIRAVLISWEPVTRSWRLTTHGICSGDLHGGLTAKVLCRHLEVLLLEHEKHFPPGPVDFDPSTSAL